MRIASSPHTLLHAARQLVGILVLPAVQLDRADRAQRGLGALADVVTAHLLAEGDVLEHGAVRHQGHVLEHHADFFGPGPAQLPRGESVDVLTLDVDRAGGRFDQPVDVSDQRRFARARQAHDAEDLTAADIEAGVADTDDTVVAVADLLL
jgi:hypothetical protein